MTMLGTRGFGSIGLLGAFILVVSCRGVATQVIVHVSVEDEAVLSGVDYLRVVTTPLNGEADRGPVYYLSDDEVSLPFAQPIQPAGPEDGAFDVRVQMFALRGDEPGSSDRLVAQQRVRGHFIPGTRQHAWVRFSSACVGRTSCGRSETCVPEADGFTCAPACFESTSEEPPGGRSPAVDCGDEWEVPADAWGSDFPCSPYECSAGGYRFRSIGSATMDASGTVFLPEDDRSQLEVSDGFFPDAMGTGDRLTFDSDGAPIVRYVVARISPTRVLLDQPVLEELSGAYGVERAYATANDWFSDRRGNLVEREEVEIGVGYGDATWTERILLTDPATITSERYYFMLTAAPGHRHLGRARRGNSAQKSIEIDLALDVDEGDLGVVEIDVPYTRIHWLEVHGWTRLHQAGVETVDYFAFYVRATGVGLSHLLVHDDGGGRAGREARADAVHIRGVVGGRMWVENSLFYNLSRAAVVAFRTRDFVLELTHSSAIDCFEFSFRTYMGCFGFFEGQGSEFLARNNVGLMEDDPIWAPQGEPPHDPSRVDGAAFFTSLVDPRFPDRRATFDPASGGNLASDRYLPEEPDRSMANRDQAGTAAEDVFVGPLADPRDLHLREGSVAIGGGVNVSPRYDYDIDDTPRASGGPRDIGADQR